LVLFPYRVGDMLLPEVKSTKPGFSVRARALGMTLFRRAVSCSTGCHVIGIAPPHPDPFHTPTWIAAARKRIGNRQPVPLQEHLEGLRAFTRDWLHKSSLKKLPTQLYGLEEWLADT